MLRLDELPQHTTHYLENIQNKARIILSSQNGFFSRIFIITLTGQESVYLIYIELFISTFILSHLLHRLFFDSLRFSLKQLRKFPYM